METGHDTFEGIQKELDALLERLAYCMKQHTDEEVTREDIARAVYSYTVAAEIVSHPLPLRNAFSQAIGARERYRGHIKARCSEGADRKGSLQAAIDALADWGNYAPCPLHSLAMQALYRSALSYTRLSSEFFGQVDGLELIPKRRVDRRKHLREGAAREVYVKNRLDPKANPIGPELFERVGEQFGMSSSLVRDAYYGLPGKVVREHLSEDTLEFLRRLSSENR